jgi:hypothetical protein
MLPVYDASPGGSRGGADSDSDFERKMGLAKNDPWFPVGKVVDSV